MNKDLEINGYKLFENCDEAVYVAKSKDDVYNYFIKNYGSTEGCQSQTKEQFINDLIEIDLSSDYAKEIKTWHNDDTGDITKISYYDEYKNVASGNGDVEVIAYLAW